MFTTPVNIISSPVKISHQDKIMTLGSCFSDNIGRKMQQSGFHILANPFGVLYNPASISLSLKKLIHPAAFAKNDVFEHKSLWNSFSYSSLFSAVSEKECLEKINASLTQASGFLQETNLLIITFGTAWVYEQKTNGKIVANCHKLPAEHFERKRLSVAQIIDESSALFSELKKMFPLLEIILTVSPIRHLKDGLHENNISKSTLLLAGEELCRFFPYVHYFPAYEIQLDELRDYRFYASDMLHPSETAVEYIWNKFSEMYFTSETQNLNKEVEQLQMDLNHRPLHPETLEYKLFKEKTEQKKANLKEKYPYLKI